MDQQRKGRVASLSLLLRELQGDNVTILEAGEGDRSPGGSRLLSEGGGFGEGGIGA